ncbi:seryl-tRNA synthetase [Borealophlyctis nickersoniae]|nr:seryl-tRNA synthetase [Borealophlyctis nickersoniae]
MVRGMKIVLGDAAGLFAPFLPASQSSQRQFNAHLNYRYFRDNCEAVAQNARNRNVLDVDVAHVGALYDQFVSADYELAELRRKRNRVAEEMSQVVRDLKQAGSEKKAQLERRRSELAKEGKEAKKIIADKEVDLSRLQSQLYDEARHIPNDTHPSVPIGDESKAGLIDTVSSPRRDSFPSGTPLRDHMDLAALHDLVDFERAGKVAGSSFYYLRNVGALVEMALTRYAMDICLSHGFVPVMTPDVVRHEVVEGCGFSPRTDDPQTYFIQPHGASGNGSYVHPGSDPRQLCLSATAEFPLAAMYAGEVLAASQVPLKMVAMGRSFRAEGLAGATNRGLYRVHQFTKVEMFSITDRDGGEEALNEIVRIQRQIFQGLGLCFRILDMPTHDLGAPAYRKFDMEAWMPGRKDWGEISSASNCTDYQARRLNIRHFRAGGSHHDTTNTTTTTDFVHTVNGTACAVPRLIIALLETHQTEDGDVLIPEALRPYLFGRHVERIERGKGMSELVKKRLD